MNDLDYLDELPANSRLSVYLGHQLAGEDVEARIEQASKALGYKRSTILKGWVAGTAKVPLKAIGPLAKHLGRDVSEILPFWLAQEMGDTDSDQIYRAARRMISFMEYSLIAVAREVYLGDDD